jgi:pyridoxine 5-phosphate synthase
MAKLGVNIDHVATLRNARGGVLPDPLQAALIAEQYGADGITAHLREDRRHIKDTDMTQLKASIQTRLNMEMANTDEMLEIALSLKPYMVTLVPERRQELTTEGGLDVANYLQALKVSTQTLQARGIRVSLFIDPVEEQIEAARESEASTVEFHTGPYCEAFTAFGLSHERTQQELKALIQSAQACVAYRIEVNAGHGLNYENVQPILQMPGLVELNIGHSIVSEAIFSGLGPAVQRMKALIT